MATLVYATTQRLLESMQADLQSSSAKALLADLRSTITQNQAKTGLAWQFIFSKLPDEFLSETGDVTLETKAILSALQLFALHQQGNMQSVNDNSTNQTDRYFTISVDESGRGYVTETVNEHTKTKYFKDLTSIDQYFESFKNQLHQKSDYQKIYHKNIGHSLRTYRLMNDDKKAIDRRFNAMITANSYDELVTHLRHLISILKSNTTEKVDYAKLAEDLCQFNKNVANQDAIKLAWSQSYYRQVKKGDK